MRILHVHGKYYPEGGAETYLRSLIKGQQAMGHDTAIIYADTPAEDVTSPCPTYFCGSSYGLRSGLRCLPDFKKAVADFMPDIIHLHAVQYDISPWILSWLIRSRPTVMTMHDTLTFCPKPIRGKTLGLSARILPDGTPCTTAMGGACLSSGCLTAALRSEGLRTSVVSVIEKSWRRRLCRRIGRIIVNSQFTKSELIRNHIAAEQVEIIPAVPELPEEWHHPQETTVSEPPLLLYVGQLAAIKGAEEFIAALSQLKDMTWRASMVGDGPDRAKIEANIAALGLENQITLHGYVARQELAGYYRRGAILVFPTLAPESWGLVGIEAMWFGLPVVAYDVGAIKEWLADGRNGYLVRAGDTSALAERLRSLLVDKTRYDAMCIEAKNTARQCLENDRSLSSFNQLYTELAGGHHAHRH